MKRLIFAAAVALSACAPAYAQQSQMHCDLYPSVAATLTGNYGESMVQRGLDSSGSMVEWWGNAETGTWTIVVTNPNGIACVPVHGEAFETFEPAAPGTDS